MKKSCLLMLTGLPRTFKKTAKNIFENIINYNKDIEFTIIISTDKNFKESPKWNGFVDENNMEYKNNIDKLAKDIMETYNGLVKKCLFMDGYICEGSNYSFPARIKQILEYEKTRYDFYILTRMDISISKKLNVHNFINKFSMITKNYNTGGGGMFRNIDWDLFWIGSEKPFKIWVHNYLDVKLFHMTNSIKNTHKLDWDETLDIASFNKISKKYKIHNNLNKMNNNKEIAKYVHHFYKIIGLLEENKYKFEIDINDGLYSTIIRN